MFDITYLNSDMSESLGIKYILSIMDCFSRKAMIYGTNTKKSNVLLNYIKDFCLHNNIPKVFISITEQNLKTLYLINFAKNTT